MTVGAPTLRRAVVLMTLSSFLVPAGGLVTAPLLARALSPDGRGELAAALAPAALMIAAATLGLPDALTYLVARRASVTRRALGWASLLTVSLGLLCLVAVILSLPFLSSGDRRLSDYILLATALAVPALVVNILRGAATGHQLWVTIAIERVIATGSKVLALAVLFATGDLTVFNAVLVNCVVTILAGVVYLPLIWRRHRDDQSEAEDVSADVPRGAPARHRATHLDPVLTSLVSFGSRVWLGSVASMMLSRASQVLMAPLSSVGDLGLYIVATTISDLPLIVALAIQGAVFGVNSKTRNAEQLTSTSRLTLLVGFVGCLAIAVTLPWWLELLFGAEFGSALVPTLMLLASALICIPGLLASSALTAWGRPGLRSLGLLIGLVVNVASFVLLVPLFGVYGACWSSIVTNIVMTTAMVLMSRRLVQVRARDYWLVRPDDVRRVWAEGQRAGTMVLGRVRRRF